jgi:hypothetical protein
MRFPNAIQRGGLESGQELHMRATIGSFSAAAAVIGTATASANAQQAVQWRVEDGGNGHWYQVFEFGATMALREQAVAAAAAIGGHPAVFESAEEWNAYRSFVPRLFNEGNGHIGLFREPQGVWLTYDGQPAGYTAWGPGLPNNWPSDRAAAFAHPAPGNCGQPIGCWEDYTPGDGFRQGCIEWSADCNGDGIVDYGQCRDGSLPDYNGNNIPDCCEAGTPCEVGNYPVQWRVEDGGNGHWYVFDPVVRDWTAAMQSAQLRGAHGATIHSSTENEFVFALAELCCNAVWLGGRGVDGACSNPDLYYWITGEPMTYQSWLAGEPNGQYGFSCALSFHPWYPDAPSWNDTPIAPEWIGPTVIEWSADCNNDGIVDYGQILQDQLVDANNNGVPDSCEVDPCPADVTGNDLVDGVDLAAILGAWGSDGQNQYDCDIDNDGVVSGTDLAFVLGGWGPCQ